MNGSSLLRKWHRKGFTRPNVELQLVSHNGRNALSKRMRVACDSNAKTVWIQTTNKDVLTAAVESGFNDMVFEDAALQQQWQPLARFNALLRNNDVVTNDDDDIIARVTRVDSATDLTSLMAAEDFDARAIVVDCGDWRIIPAENLVAKFQSMPHVQLIAAATSAADAAVMLGALEHGTAGVLLQTDDAAEVRKLAVELRSMQHDGAALRYDSCEVVSVEGVGMGDRVCVDVCSMLHAGEGMLVGSFSRALFLVHSECRESSYINSRPFRVNAGAVHAYVQATDNRTAYLSELKSGMKVMIADARGGVRTAVVGRVKIERRPLVMVTCRSDDGVMHSTLLQNAETVALVGPAADGSDDGGCGWHATAVTQLQPSQRVYVRRQDAARHTGIAVDETIIER